MKINNFTTIPPGFQSAFKIKYPERTMSMRYNPTTIVRAKMLRILIPKDNNIKTKPKIKDKVLIQISFNKSEPNHAQAPNKTLITPKRITNQNI